MQQIKPQRVSVDLRVGEIALHYKVLDVEFYFELHPYRLQEIHLNWASPLDRRVVIP